MSADGLASVALAFRVADVDQALAGSSAPAAPRWTGRPPGFPARAIDFIHPKSLGSVLVHLIERDAGRAGGVGTAGPGR